LDSRYLRLVEDNLKQLTSGFGRAVSDQRRKLSPKEVEICAMIKNGLSTKEIAGLLHTSDRTIDNHRNRIRKKLGVSKQQVNLAVYLQTL
jgi:DNA-binding NarL/FixJ family response regulator